VPTACTCLVSFTDSEGIRHSVEVTASTLYEAAASAINEFRRCGFTSNAPGPPTRLTVAVKIPATSHEVQWGKIEAWLQSAGKPNGAGDEGEAAGVAEDVNGVFGVMLRRLVASW